jgi:hypothetical protein
VTDQRHHDPKLSIVDISAVMENDWGEIDRKLAQAHGVFD